MKSKLFGLGAKLALAILAVGTTLTGCYDSENGDVTKPYVAPDAVYSIVGTVSTTDGKAIGNTTVKLSGVLEGSATTDANGSYSIRVTKNGGVTGDVTVAIEGKANEYKAATATTKVDKIVNGQAVAYYLNIVAESLVEPVVPDPELTFTSSVNSESEDATYQGEHEDKDGYHIALDLRNDGNNPVEYTRWFSVNDGALVYEDTEGVFVAASTKAAMTEDEVKAKIKETIIADLGIIPVVNDEKKFGKKDMSYTFVLPSKTALKNVTVSYIYQVKKYEFSYDGKKYPVTIKSVVKALFDSAFTLTETYHGHGHGHGHGDDINAGGGIIGAE